MDSLASHRGSMPVARDVPCREFTIAPMDGCEVVPAHTKQVLVSRSALIEPWSMDSKIC